MPSAWCSCAHYAQHAGVRRRTEKPCRNFKAYLSRSGRCAYFAGFGRYSPCAHPLPRPAAARFHANDRRHAGGASASRVARLFAGGASAGACKNGNRRAFGKCAAGTRSICTRRALHVRFGAMPFKRDVGFAQRQPWALRAALSPSVCR